MKHFLIVASIAGTLSLEAPAQVIGTRTGSTCLDLRDGKITASGLLKLETYPGPPNYESVDAGDRAEEAFMLELPDLDCVDETPGENYGTSNLFIQVHVSSHDDAVLNNLRTLIGRRVTIEGTAFQAHTAHHRAPVVLMATTAIAKTD